ncbi:GEVED domain-containing protein [Aureivirga sp. CE67]|uniref:GEVED domain-containing protein n=1 Tax=Aureivirga sp. CE67 TaxID=1788983 RepID=UPI0018CB479C|nr:GEVED domain-containing protein [Aureivirga sp. CE67]
MIKKITLIASLFTAFISHAQSTDAAPYCSGDFSGGEFMDVEKYISKVELNTLSNESGDTQFALPHYVYYDNIEATKLQKEETYELKITHDDGVSIHGIAAWIDFNGDEIFEESEKIEQSIFPSGMNPLIYSFTIPANAKLGKTRMRVRIYEDDAYSFSFPTGEDPIVLPCDYDLGEGEVAFDWGETEDYDVEIIAEDDLAVQEIGSNILSVYPNPVKDVLTIENIEENSLIEIYNSLG